MDTTTAVDKPVLTIARESWAEVVDEMRPMWYAHWQEVDPDNAELPLEVDEERYAALDAAGVLHIMTARQAGVLAGYHIAVISTHMHHRNTLHGVTDVYYVVPAFRDGSVLARLLRAVERSMRELGVVRLYTGNTLAVDVGTVLQRAGYTEIERLYSKILRGD